MSSANLSYAIDRKYRMPTVTFEEPVPLEQFRVGLFSAAKGTGDIALCRLEPGVTFEFCRDGNPQEQIRPDCLAEITFQIDDVFFTAKARYTSAPDNPLECLIEDFSFHRQHIIHSIGSVQVNAANAFMEQFAKDLVSQLDYTLREAELVTA